MIKHLFLLLLSFSSFSQTEAKRVEVECSCTILESISPGFCNAFTWAVQQDWPKEEKDWKIKFEGPLAGKKKSEFNMVLVYKGENITATYRLKFEVKENIGGIELGETLTKEAVQAAAEYRKLVGAIMKGNLAPIFAPNKGKK